ncbi:MAG TPA: hypothetical protein VFG04_26220 [Planctomycetaceae bacterium]|nr:hypothetical protein [Planctomycetaceae bacterium]
MLRTSTSDQQAISDRLSLQVQQAVEVLIRSLDRADQDSRRALLKVVPASELYEAAVTVMMRLVFLSAAEERGLGGDRLYDKSYSLSTIERIAQGKVSPPRSAWTDLLSSFRAVFCGTHHERMKLSACPGKLFDPDRFPFLEGRPASTSWRTQAINPLPIDNRTALYLLRSVRSVEIQGRTRKISFRSLDVEQIGHIYESLLDQTAKRATEPMIGLIGSQGIGPVIELSRLERLREAGKELLKSLKEQTTRSQVAIQRALDTPLAEGDAQELKAACGKDETLFEHVQPFSGLMRKDVWGRPFIIHAGDLSVTAGNERRSTGTHYTPASLTEPIVRYTLEPLVYDDPSDAKPADEWRLRSARQLLDLKICDLACGAGAFLVQACRYLSERLLEAWEDAEKQHPDVPGVLPYGDASTQAPHEELLPRTIKARQTAARRIVAQRCLYGVDKSPLAVEMAKLSLWLLTISKDQPFTFLDHCLRSGDSLVGIDRIEQLTRFSLRVDDTEPKRDPPPLAKDEIENSLRAATELRRQIAEQPSSTSKDIQRKQTLLKKADGQVQRLTAAADRLLKANWMPTSELKCRSPSKRMIEADSQEHLNRISVSARFHWPLEFPEVFLERGGFDAFLGNPPFINAIQGGLSPRYKDWLASRPHDLSGTADFAFHFLAQAHHLARPDGAVGLLMPRPFLNAKAAAALRQTLLTIRPPAVLFSPEHSSPFASANVKVVAIVLCNRRAGRCTSWLDGSPREVEIRSDNWWSAIAVRGGAQQAAVNNAHRVADVFDVAASMTTENAYDLKPILHDRADTVWPRLVTTGLIDPGKCLWGDVRCRYLKSVYSHPVVCPSGPISADLSRRLATATRPKILVAGVAGPGGGLEAFVDERGLTCGAVSTYTITHPADSIAALRSLCDFLNSADVAARVFTELNASAMGSGLLTIKKAFLSDLRLSAPAEAH